MWKSTVFSEEGHAECEFWKVDFVIFFETQIFKFYELSIVIWIRLIGHDLLFSFDNEGSRLERIAVLSHSKQMFKELQKNRDTYEGGKCRITTKHRIAVKHSKMF